MKLEISRQILEKYSPPNFTEIVPWEPSYSMRVDGEIGIAKLRVVLGNFAKAPKNIHKI
jgi:hypothetical protein